MRDAALQGFALAFDPGQDTWLWEKIEEDLRRDRAFVVARALTLAGFAHDTERAIGKLEAQAIHVSGWLNDVRESALDRARRARFMRHWFKRFLDEDDPVVSWSAFQLFARCADRRCFAWMENECKERGFIFRGDSRKMKHFRANYYRIAKTIQEWEKKELKERLFHTKLEKDIFPWMSMQKLSREGCRRFITGLPIGSIGTE